MKKTLMEKFIDERLRLYRNIGRGRKRRLAALYNALTNKEQKQVAALAETTQNAVAVWRTRELFKDDMVGNVSAFAERVMKSLLASTEGEYGQFIIPDELIDHHQWSDQLREAVSNKILASYGRNSFLAWQLIMRLGKEYDGVKMLRPHLESLTRKAEQSLLKTRLSQEDRQVIATAFKLEKLYRITLEQCFTEATGKGVF